MYTYVLIKDGVKTRTYECSYNGSPKITTTSSKRFPCIGGPFDQQHVTRIDIDIANLSREYTVYNRAGWHNSPTQIFIHKSLFPCL